MAKACQVEQVCALSGGFLKKKWLVQTKEVENRLFVKIDKWDHRFVFFATGKTKQLRAEKDSSVGV